MKRRNVLLGFLLLFLFTGLAGCFTNADPDPGQTITMEIGDVQEFTVAGCDSEEYHFDWWTKFGNKLNFQKGTDGETSLFEFTADPRNVSNKLTVVCDQTYYLYDLYLDWMFVIPHIQKTIEWKIEIPQTPPIWQGNYIVENRNDLIFLQENGYEEVTNDLIISSRTLVALKELNGIKKVGGSLIIEFNPLLRKITGLNGIITVDGNIEISSNLILISIEGFNSLTSVGGDLDIALNDRLTSLKGMNNLVSVGESLHISLNDRLESIEGLDSLTSVGSDFSISQNPELCTYLAEELRDQVQAGGGIGGIVSIESNKDCF